MIFRTGKNRFARKEAVAGWLFVLPEFIGIMLMAIFPLLFTLYISLCDWNLVGGINSIRFVGFDNFVTLWDDGSFHKALVNNLYYAAGTVPAALIISLILAVLIQNRKFMKDYFKVTFFIPYICSTVAIAAVWQFIYHPSKGPLNQFFMQIGYENPPNWLVDTKYALLAIMIIYVWQTIGYKVIIYIAGLTNISDELYESAEIDGANPVQQLIYITVPLLGPTTFFLTITSIIASFKAFDLIKFLTDGGPNEASTVIVYQIYELGFEQFRMGYASAMAWILFVIVVLITSITWLVQKKKTFQY